MKRRRSHEREFLIKAPAPHYTLEYFPWSQIDRFVTAALQVVGKDGYSFYCYGSGQNVSSFAAGHENSRIFLAQMVKAVRERMAQEAADGSNTIQTLLSDHLITGDIQNDD